MGAADSVRSLQTAFIERDSINWRIYSFASNASFTGAAYATIRGEAARLGLKDTHLEFLGPEHWDKLCEKHPAVAADRFDYRVRVTKKRVSRAFENQRYYARFVAEYSAQIQSSDVILRISNNRTPLILEVPFSPELTVKHLVDVIKDLLGISLDWANYDDIGTSAGPSVSLTIDRVAQEFPGKIGDLMARACFKNTFGA